MSLPIRRWCAAAVVFSLMVACGGGGGSVDAPPLPVDPNQPGGGGPGSITVLAGDTGTGGFADGTGRIARFLVPSAIAVDAAGDVFVADTFNLAIRKMTPKGVVTTPYPMAGRVRDLAFAPDGELYFTANDAQFAGVYRASPSGSVTQVVAAGVIPGAWSIAVGTDTTLYVSSPAGIHRFKPGATPALIAAPPQLLQQLVVDSAGNLYGSMGGAVIVRVQPDGSWAPFAGSASDARHADGQRADARFSNVSGLALDASGRLWAADNFTDARQSGMMRRVAADGTVSSPFGTRVLFRYGLSADVAFDRQGTLYILSGNGVAKVNESGEVTPLAGSDMPAPEQQAPIFAHQLAVGPGSEIYTVETVDTRLKVRKFDSLGRRVPFGADGQGVTLENLAVDDIASVRTLAMVVDGSGVIHLSYARIQQEQVPAGTVSRGTGGAIVRITPQGQLSLVLAANSFAPSGLALDTQGNYLYLDLIDGWVRRRPADGGAATLFSGAQAVPTALNARVPRFVADTDFRAWIIDYENRKVGAVNQTFLPFVTPIAGGGQPGNGAIVDGRGHAADFASLAYGVSIGNNNLVVSDHTTLRRITGNGDVTTVAGTPRAFGVVDDLVPTALPGLLGNPRAIAVGPDGAIYLNSAGALVKVRLP